MGHHLKKNEAYHEQNMALKSDEILRDFNNKCQNMKFF